MMIGKILFFSGWLGVLNLVFIATSYAAPVTWQDAGAQQPAAPLEVERIRKLPNTPRLQVLPAHYPTHPAPIIYHAEPPAFNALTFYPGSLKENIQRVAKQCGWHTVVWKTPYDYNWVGTVHFIDGYLPTILHKVLNGYPLQAVFYQGNHILVIVPRNMT